MNRNYDPIRGWESEPSSFGEYSDRGYSRFVEGTDSSIYGSQFVVERKPWWDPLNLGNQAARSLKRQLREEGSSLYVDSVINEEEYLFYREEFGPGLKTGNEFMHSKFLIRDEARLRLDTSPVLRDSRSIGRDIFYETSNPIAIKEASNYFSAIESGRIYDDSSNRYIFADNNILKRISQDINQSTGKVIIHSANWDTGEVTYESSLGEDTLNYLLDSMRANRSRVYASSGRTDKESLLHSTGVNVLRGPKGHYNLAIIEDINEEGEDVLYISTKRSTRSSIREIAIRISSLEDPQAYQYFYDYHTGEKAFGLDQAISIKSNQDKGLSYELATAMEEGLILPSNMGASYFYARAVYNTTMRQSGNAHMVINHEHAGVATTAYKLNHLVREGMLPSFVPRTYVEYDKELYTQGAGAWVNEYVGIPSGWGRIYKDDLGFLPSVLSAFGAALDKSYLYYTGDQDVLGLNTIYQPLTTKSAFYQDQSFTGQGLFENVLGFGSSFMITTASSVALYLSLGEPISLLVSETVRSNIEQTINMAFPKAGVPDVEGIQKLGAQASRQFTLGAGGSYLNPYNLRRNLIFSSFTEDEGGAIVKNTTEFYSVDNFNLSYYHLNSLMRHRGASLLRDIAKPFLMSVINPYKIEDENVFGSKLDDLIEEVGKFIDLSFDFGKAGDRAVEELFRVRAIAEEFHRDAYEKAELAISRYENHQRMIGTPGYTVDGTDMAKYSADAVAWKASNRTLDPILGYLIDDAPAPLDYVGNLLVDSKGMSLATFKTSEQENLAFLSTSLNHTSIGVINAGESRQMEIAKKLQGVLDEIPLNPRHWRIFNNETTLKSRSIVKDYAVLGDLLSFEDFTQSMRKLVLGEGGITSLLSRYEITSDIGEEGIARNTKNVVDRIHTFWNIAINAPQDALKYLKQRRKVISRLEKSRSIYKGMEFSLASTDDIAWANSMTSKSFKKSMKDLATNKAFQDSVLQEAIRTAQIQGSSSTDIVNKIYTKIFPSRVREQAIKDLDPYSRQIQTIDHRYLSAATAFDEETSKMGEDAIRITSIIADKHREDALGILSLTSDKTFTKRIAKLKPGLGMDATSKVTKSKLMTYTFFGLALASATESLFRSSQGVSLYRQLATALDMGANDDSSTINFSANGPLAPISGTGPRLLWSAATTAATAYAAYEIAGALREVTVITNTINTTSLVDMMNRNPDLRVQHTSRTGGVETVTEATTATELKKFQHESMFGEFRILGTTSEGHKVNTYMMRELMDDASKIILKKNVDFVQGRSVATAAIAFTVMSTAVMGAKAGAAYTLNKVREQEKGLAPLLLPAGGAVAGYGVAKALGSNLGFGFGLLGMGIGIGASFLPSSLLENMFSLGRGKNDVDPNNFMVAGELSTFISSVKHRVDTNKASRLEMMAGLYAQTYSSMLGIMKGDNDRFTHVVARQSPLPAIQFFFAATTEGQYRDEQGNITSPGQTSFTTGIQTAPILGGSFSVNLPINITPGGGVLGITYSDKSNMLDLMAGVQTATLTISTAAVATKMFNTVVNKGMAAMGVNSMHNNHYVDTLFNISNTIDKVGSKLLIETPLNIVTSMFKSDLNLAGKVLKSGRTLQSHSVPTYMHKNSPVQMRTNLLGKYLASAVIGSYVGSLLGSMIGSQDQETLETYSFWGNIAGITGGPIIRAGLNYASENQPISSAISSTYRRFNINPPPLMPKAPARLTRALKGKGKLAATIGIATAVAGLMTSEDFGIAEGMGGFNLTRLSIMLLYGASVGTAIHHLSGTFMDASDTLRKWQNLEEARESLKVAAGSGNYISKSVNRARSLYLDFIQSGVESDMDYMFETIYRSRSTIEAISRSGQVQEQTMESIIRASDTIQKAVESNTNAGNHTRRVMATAKADPVLGELRVGSLTVDELGQAVTVGRSKIIGRVDANLAGRRFYRGTKNSLIGFAFAFSVVAGQIGEGSIQKGLQAIHGDGGLLDWGDKQGGFLHGLSNVISSTLKLITFMDADVDLPSQYSKYLSTPIDRSQQGGRKGAIKRSLNLVKARNNPLSSVGDLLSNTENMFVLNSSNAFIQLVGPVGFTFRSGEYGKRVNRYVQIQAPGADISTASYSMAAAYGFKAALNGRYDSGFNIQNAMANLNQHLRSGKPLDETLLRQTSLSIVSLTAKEQPLKKRRRYSGLSQEGLDFISADPILTHSLKYRKQILESLSYQPVASLGSQLVMQASTNHVLSDVGLLKALFSRDPQALRTLMDDPFGLLSKNIVISSTKSFSPSGTPNRVKSQNENVSDDSAWMSQSSIVSTVENGYTLPFLSAISNTLSSLWGGNGVPSILKWGILLGLSFTGIGAGLYSLGSMSLNADRTKMSEDIDKFYTSNLHDYKLDRKGNAYSLVRANTRRSIAGQPVMGPDNKRIVEINKGNNLFSINQYFSEEQGFINRLNKALLDYQNRANELHLNFRDGKTFGQVMQETVVSPQFEDFISKEINAIALTENKSPREVLNTKLKEAYTEIMEEYTRRYLGVLADTQVVVNYEGNNVRVSLLALMGGDGVEASEIVAVSEALTSQLPADKISPEDALARLGEYKNTPSLMNADYIRATNRSVEDLVDGVVSEAVRRTWGAPDSMLTKGRVYSMKEGDVDNYIKGALNYINDRIAYALSSEKTSPLFSFKNQFGGLSLKPANDRLVREQQRLGGMLRRDLGLELSDQTLDLVQQMPGVSTTRSVVNLRDNKVLLQSDIQHLAKYRDQIINSNHSVVRIPGRKKGTWIEVNKTQAQDILSMSGKFDDAGPSSKALVKARAMYRGFQPVQEGFMKALDVGTFALDLFEAVDVFGAYSRLGSSYTSGSYTEAQRKALALETGDVTTNSLLTVGFGALMMNAGAIATGVGGLATAALAGAGIAVGASAAVVGGVVLAAGAVLLGAGYFLMPKEWRSKVNNAIGSAYSFTSESIGNGLMSIGNQANRILGPRGASSVLNAMGGLLGGLTVGAALVSLAAFSGPVLATLGIAAGIGTSLGMIGGLLAPNQLGTLSRTVSGFLSSVPIIGPWLANREGQWVSREETIGYSPFFTGTAGQAIQVEFERHMDIASNGTAMSQVMLSRNVYGSVEGEENYITKKSGNLIGRITPGSLMDPTLDREIKARARLYSHTIISRYIWSSIVSNSSNKRVIREAEKKYRTHQIKQMEILERESKAIITTPTTSRKNNGELEVSKVLVDNIVDIANNIEAESREGKKSLHIKVKRDSIPSTSLTAAVRDYRLDNAKREDIKNNVSSSTKGDIKIKQEIDEEMDFIRSSRSVNSSKG